jgi:5-formyltetrahydrofolate cyclo-ligase
MNKGMEETKQTLRQQIKSALADIPGGSREKKGKKIAGILCSLPEWWKADVIFLFLSFNGEVKTDEMVLQAILEKKIVAVPRVTGRNMAFHQITGLNDGLEMNRMGIREPFPSLPVIEPGGLLNNLVIAPGLAFDRERNRLGRGGGYYDRFICKIREKWKTSTTIVGICFSEQLVDLVPVSSMDELVDMIVTDEGVIR